MLRVGGRFARVEPRRRMASFVRGLLAGLPRVNCQSIAEHAGDAGPRGMQRLLSAAVWDEAGVRDDLRSYVLEHFADPGAVLVVDETGDLKKGTATVGVQRQYTGTAGRTENAQVAVYLAYAAPAGCAFIDRALYLPRSWTSDPARCRAAGVPQDTGFATKPALAKVMITGALDAGTPAAWVTADEVYGQDPQLRAELARRGLGYVLAIPKRHLITTGIGGRTAAELARRLPARAWQRMSAGPGAKGPRWYDWALIEAADPAVTEGGGLHWLLIRRAIADGEYAFYRACAPGPADAASGAGPGARRPRPPHARHGLPWQQRLPCDCRVPQTGMITAAALPFPHHQACVTSLSGQYDAPARRTVVTCSDAIQVTIYNCRISARSPHPASGKAHWSGGAASHRGNRPKLARGSGAIERSVMT